MGKIKAGDDVIVIAGKDKGRRGSVASIQGNESIVIDGVNMIKKHVKGNPAVGDPGGIVERESPISKSNVAIFNPASKKADKVGYRFEGGKKIRIYKSDSSAID